LSGFVDRQELKNKAEEITRNVQGVVDVKNNILIKGQNSTQP
jgi:osmotically-inducible protein OsmY